MHPLYLNYIQNHLYTPNKISPNNVIFSNKNIISNINQFQKLPQLFNVPKQNIHYTTRTPSPSYNSYNKKNIIDLSDNRKLKETSNSPVVYRKSINLTNGIHGNISYFPSNKAIYNNKNMIYSSQNSPHYNTLGQKTQKVVKSRNKRKIIVNQINLRKHSYDNINYNMNMNNPSEVHNKLENKNKNNLINNNKVIINNSYLNQNNIITQNHNYNTNNINKHKKLTVNIFNSVKQNQNININLFTNNNVNNVYQDTIEITSSNNNQNYRNNLDISNINNTFNNSIDLSGINYNNNYYRDTNKNDENNLSYNVHNNINNIDINNFNDISTISNNSSNKNSHKYYNTIQNSEQNALLKNKINIIPIPKNKIHHLTENGVIIRPSKDLIQTNLLPYDDFDLDEFKIIKQIGVGGFGKIYSVQWNRNNEIYALKKLILDKDELNIIKNKVKIVKDLIRNTGHYGFIKIYGDKCIPLKNKNEFLYYVIMELGERDWLKELKMRESYLLYYSEKELFDIIIQLVKTLALMQKNRVTHRDLKPQNILLCKGIFKLCDFGESKILNGNGRVYQHIRGSELYMSPIIFYALKRKEKHVWHNTYKSDVYSLGMCILLAAGFSRKLLCDIREIKDINVIYKIINNALNKRYSEKIINLIVKMLQLEENLRFDFIELEKYLSELSRDNF